MQHRVMGEAPTQKAEERIHPGPSNGNHGLLYNTALIARPIIRFLPV